MSRGRLAVTLLVLGAASAHAQRRCPSAADSLVIAGWTRYRAGAIAAADSLFDGAAAVCPGHTGARVGAGYAALRLGDTAQARRRFEAVLDDAPETVDALSGLGILAWRSGDLAAVRARFLAVLRLDPDHAEAREYLARLPAGLGLPVERPPLRLPASVEAVARVRGEHFEVRRNDRWQPFYVKGVNLGAALPGRFPSEFPDAATYAEWIAAMADMGANAVRVYTIHPPAFYAALQRHNERHPNAAVYLIQGVWAELPDDAGFDAPAWERAFFDEMDRAVDVVHGRADVLPRPGHAAGSYTADVASWTLAFIVGREWEPYAVEAFNDRRASEASHAGRYLEVQSGTPMDAWLARACDHLVAYETDTYRVQRPVAYVNWPTLDPLHHPTEATDAEEVGLRRRAGEPAAPDPKEFDNDAVALDPTLVRSTEAFQAGFFAAYHAYPYYPDFMILDSGYETARSSLGRSNYFGYLRDLQRHHAGMPVVIAEYGVPTGLGVAHLQNQGWHHGGHDEAAMAAIDARLTREIAEAGMAGGIVFAWIDEWFKRNWLVADFELPADRNALWLNRLDPEQQYGMIALEPPGAVPGATLADRVTPWRAVPPLYDDTAGVLRAAADEAALWLLVEPREGSWEELYVGVDLLEEGLGAFRWPDGVGPAIPVGVEFALRLRGDTARLLVAPGSNPWRVQALATPRRTAPTVAAVENPPPGFFSGRFALELHARPAAATSDGRYESLLVLTNPRRFGRDGSEYAGMGYDRGFLPRGEPPFGVWERDAERGIVEFRIPWILLNVTDPSGRHVLQYQLPGSEAAEHTVVSVDAVGVVAAAKTMEGGWARWPASGVERDVARFGWPTWETPRWRARRRPVYDALREAFRALTAGGSR